MFFMAIDFTSNLLIMAQKYIQALKIYKWCTGDVGKGQRRWEYSLWLLAVVMRS